LREEIVRTTRVIPSQQSYEDTVQGIFASTLAHLEEAQRTIGRLELERDCALARVHELEGLHSSSVSSRSRLAAGLKEWRVAATAAALLIALPLLLAVGLTRGGIPVLSLASGGGLTIMDVSEVLVVSLVATILIQSWVTHTRRH
jgi:hypothetical protein